MNTLNNNEAIMLHFFRQLDYNDQREVIGFTSGMIAVADRRNMAAKKETAVPKVSRSKVISLFPAAQTGRTATQV